MNIFFLDEDPERAAHYYCDQHIGKIRLEISQLLSTSFYLNSLLEIKERNKRYLIEPDFIIYKMSYKNHPLAKWVRESKENWNWAFYHLVSLQNIWINNGKNGDITKEIIRTFDRNKNSLIFDKEDLTEVPLCIYPFLKEIYGNKATIEKAVIAYRNYINVKIFKNGVMPTYKINGIPFWYNL